jgi:hypothetical protein
LFVSIAAPSANVQYSRRVGEQTTSIGKGSIDSVVAELGNSQQRTLDC